MQTSESQKSQTRLELASCHHCCPAGRNCARGGGYGFDVNSMTLEKERGEPFMLLLRIRLHLRQAVLATIYFPLWNPFWIFCASCWFKETKMRWKVPLLVHFHVYQEERSSGSTWEWVLQWILLILWTQAWAFSEGRSVPLSLFIVPEYVLETKDGGCDTFFNVTSSIMCPWL